MNSQSTDRAEAWPGAEFGLPESGPGALATWGQRVAAILLDWAACTLLAFGIFGPIAIYGTGWQRFIVLGLFFVESAALSALVGGSFGQIIARIAIARVDGKPLGWRAVPRALLVCLGLPPLIIGADRRGLQDLLCETVVVRRR